MIYDINLVPKARKKASGQGMFLTAAVSIFCLVAVLFFGVYKPMKEKNDLKEQIREQEEELASYADVQARHTSLLAEIEAAEQTDKIMQILTDSNLKMTEILDDLEESVPKNITIESISLAEGLITIKGIAPTYQSMAEYVVNLRKMKNVLNVTFLSAQSQGSAGQSANNTVENNAIGIPTITSKDQKASQEFTLGVNLNSSDAISEYLAQIAAEQEKQESQAQQEVQNGTEGGATGEAD